MADPPPSANPANPWLDPFYNPWLEALKQIRGSAVDPTVARQPTPDPDPDPDDATESPQPSGAKTDESPELPAPAPMPADAALDDEVAWRFQAMLPQVPRRGGIPTLLARPELRDQWRELRSQGRCDSCGEANLPPGWESRPAPRCTSCCLAAEMACNVKREGVPGPGP
jgi:hypothetical protein